LGVGEGEEDGPGGLGRANCGWCHVDIHYKDGGKGAKCADVRDNPWNCPDQYDTHTCSPGWACDSKSGTCIMASPGEGFGSKSKCEGYCGGKTDTYRCDAANYECEVCKDGDKGCSADRASACKNCSKPPSPTTKYKCDKSDPKNPKCLRCSSSHKTGCSSHASACNSCHAPRPPSKRYSCHSTKHTCYETTHGSSLAGCHGKCGHITPHSLLGEWRGLMVKKGEPSGFDMGEFDLEFKDKSVTIKYPNRQQDVFDVYSDGSDSLITL